MKSCPPARRRVPTRRCGGDAGAATVWMLSVTVIVFAVCGLVYDGGLLITGKRTAINHAEEAARAGAQALDPHAVYGETAALQLDPTEAESRATAFIVANGWRGSATAGPDSVTVTIEQTQAMTFLQMFGVRDRFVTGTATARPYTGITRR